MNFTIIGGQGFIGRALVARLRADRHEVFVPRRDDSSYLHRNLGHVIYAAGVTADFRSRPFDTIRAHIGVVSEILEQSDFDSLLYLSSARMYRNAENSREDAAIALRSNDPEDFYDFTKLTGESLCYASRRSNVRIARLANVIGQDFRSSNFVFDLIQSACHGGRIELRSALDSEKDYIMVNDVCTVVPKIATLGQCRCYNIASGFNTSHALVVNEIAAATGAVIEVVPGAPRVAGPPIDIERLQTEFGFVAQDVLPEIPKLVNYYRRTSNV